MKNLIFALFVSCSLFAEDYKLEKAAAPPAAAANLLSAEGIKVMDPAGKPLCEIWMRKQIPTGEKSAEMLLTLPEVAHGTFMGVVTFPANYRDRRGQTIKAGTYTLRYSYYPQNGDHQGVAPQRDFLLLTPMDLDKNLEANPNFKELTELSMKASGTPHPAVYSFWKEEESFTPGIRQLGETDWVLYTDQGGIKLAIILVGQAEG
ncbi:MAG: hypothetical protein OHK0021_13380 [Bryobacter sp.]